MDSFVTLIIFFLLIGLVERLLKGRSGSQKEPPSDKKASAKSAGEREALGGQRPRSELERIILEQLGVGVEPPSTVETRPETKERTGRPALEGQTERTGRPTRAPERPAPPRIVHTQPRRRSEAGEAAQRRRRAPEEPRRREAERRRTAEPTRVPIEAEIPEVVSLEQIGMGEIGEPTSLERPREPADHDRFHRRYSVPKPVATHDEFHHRYVVPPRHRPARERRARLPREPGWSDVQTAIVWTEVIGPPKGLID